MRKLTVKKRNGAIVPFDSEKIFKRIAKLSYGLDVNPDIIALEVGHNIHDGITTSKLDELAAKISADFATSDSDYSILGGRILMSALQKETPNTFGGAIAKMYDRYNTRVIDRYNDWGADRIEALINPNDDLEYDFFGAATLQKAYLMRDSHGVVVERPTYMFMRVCLSLAENFAQLEAWYSDVVSKKISLATPILFNMGTRHEHGISCNLLFNVGDDINGLMDTVRDAAISSSHAAGIGLFVGNLRSCRTKISSTGGDAHGVVKYAKLINEVMRCYNQGGKRMGSCALYLPTWHRDVLEFLQLRLPIGEEKERARDLFLALCVNDNFMRAVENDAEYHLFCPHILKQNGIVLYETYGEEFEKLYNTAVEQGLGHRIMAREIWNAITRSQMEGGLPYILYIDNVNKANNHTHAFGAIKQSNLCIEIVQYTDSDNTAQCTLGSIPLQNHAYNHPTYGYIMDYNSLDSSVTKLTQILNSVIKYNDYSTDRARKAGLDQRAIAIGIQGLADVFALMRLPFDSDDARFVSNNIAAQIYYSALNASADYAQDYSIVHTNFERSAYAKGIFQFEMQGVSVDQLKDQLGIDRITGIVPNLNWEKLRIKIMRGLANSLTTGYMPTAGTAGIMGSSECIEPYMSNIFQRETMVREFVVINKHLVKYCKELGIWNEEMRLDILKNSGSIQKIDIKHYLAKSNPTWVEDELNSESEKVKAIFKTIWEIKQSVLIKMAADRGKFIDQTQSMNLYLDSPNNAKISTLLFLGWRLGLKTGVYYFRSKPKLAENMDLVFKQRTAAKYDKNVDEPLPPKPENSPFSCFGCSA